MIGEQILNYKIASKIGEGGMGAVYLATHAQLDRKAAIKVLHSNYVNNAMVRERFKNEAATMARLKHANIVDLYDYMEAPTGLYLIMEYVQGKPLDEYMTKISGPIPEDKAIQLFSHILDGFAYAHKQGVVHRDIKPSNLIITPDFEVKILDFGIAKLLNNSKTQTQAGTKMGTVLYMSPEQVKGFDVDNRSDIYALGVTLFQMLTGKCPYDEENATEYEVYHQILNQPLPRAKTFYPKVSDKMQGIIDKATAKKPEARFQSCEEFKQALLENYRPENKIQDIKNTILGTDNLNTGSRLAENPTFAQTTWASPKTNPEISQTFPPKKRKRGIAGSTIFLWLALLLGGAYFVLFNPLRIPKLQPYALLDKKFKSMEEKKAEIQQKIEQFYAAMESHDFEQVRPFYAPVLDNYFGNQNIGIEAVEAASKTYWQKYIAEKHEINWQTLDYQEDEKGNHIARFSMKYAYRTQKSQWVSNNGVRELKLNPEWQVYHIVNLSK